VDVGKPIPASEKRRATVQRIFSNLAEYKCMVCAWDVSARNVSAWCVGGL